MHFEIWPTAAPYVYRRADSDFLHLCVKGRAGYVTRIVARYDLETCRAGWRYAVAHNVRQMRATLRAASKDAAPLLAYRKPVGA